jgi:uncharacterized protein YjbI with pentapeptide repeats
MAEASLYSADIRGADLSGASFTDGTLRRALTEGVNFSGVALKGTMMPDGSTHQ